MMAILVIYALFLALAGRAVSDEKMIDDDDDNNDINDDDGNQGMSILRLR